MTNGVPGRKYYSRIKAIILFAMWREQMGGREYEDNYRMDEAGAGGGTGD